MNQHTNQQNMWNCSEYAPLVKTTDQEVELILHEVDHDWSGSVYSHSPSTYSIDSDSNDQPYQPAAKRSRVTVDTGSELGRPGRAPKVPDASLTPTELDRRNRRRARNREAAARQRDRRVKKVEALESEVAELSKDKQQLVAENEQLKRELDELKFKLDLEAKQQQQRCKPAPLKLPSYDDAQQQQQQGGGAPETFPKMLFSPNGTFVLQTPAELKNFDFTTCMKKERPSSISDFFTHIL